MRFPLHATPAAPAAVPPRTTPAAAVRITAHALPVGLFYRSCTSATCAVLLPVHCCICLLPSHTCWFSRACRCWSAVHHGSATLAANRSCAAFSATFPAYTYLLQFSLTCAAAAPPQGRKDFAAVTVLRTCCRAETTTRTCRAHCLAALFCRTITCIRGSACNLPAFVTAIVQFTAVTFQAWFCTP